MRFILILMMTFFMTINLAHADPGATNDASSFEVFMIAKELKVIRILPSVYVIEDQGGIAPSYSMIVDISDDNLLLVDSTSSEKITQVLAWAKQRFTDKKIVAINTHHHIDRTGGNAVLIKENIPVYGSDLTAALAKKNHETAPNHTFLASAGMTLDFDNQKVEIFYPGPAHSEDNTVVYIPDLKLLFGGCMIVPFQKIYLVDGVNIKNWPNALEKLKRFDIQWVIPGHPANLQDDLNFSPSLIAHTEMLLKTGKTGEFTPSEAQALKASEK